MIRKLSILLVLLLCLSGCSLAQGEALVETGEKYADRMVGVFITEEYVNLFEIEQYLKDHPEDVRDGEIDGDTFAYEGRVYAVKEGERYVFPGLEGTALFVEYVSEDGSEYVRINSEGYLANGHSAFISTGSGQEIALEGTIYTEQGRDLYTFHMNPVYQDKDGNLYLMAGSGMNTNDLGECSQSLDSEVEITVNGQKMTYSCHVKVTYISVPKPERVVVLQMDGNSVVLSREEYIAGQLPESITPLAETAYLIVESHNAKTVSREIIAREKDVFDTFFALENGICQKVGTKVVWETE